MAINLDKCPNCESNHVEYWGRTSGKITLHDAWSKCSDCRLIFANPLKTSEEIRTFYAQEFYETKEIDNSKSEYKVLFNWINHLILKYQPRPKTLLEIGCGKGLFLEQFSTIVQLEKVVGIEFDKKVTDQINVNAPLEVHNDYYENIQLHEKFDVIFCWHVIEHVIDLHAFLEKIKKDSSGIVVFGTPAFGWLNEMKAFIQRKKTVGTSSDHTFFFTQKILIEILRSHGFEIIYKKVYVDNVNDEMSFSKNPFKAFILKSLSFIMKISTLPLFGKQIIIVKK